MILNSDVLFLSDLSGMSKQDVCVVIVSFGSKKISIVAALPKMQGSIML